MTVKITYFVHGTTTDNESHLATGWAQGELSELGIKQSEELRELIGHMRFDAVFCSDLKRAVDSANIAFSGKYEIIEDERLREADYGRFTQAPLSSFKPRMTEYIDRPLPGQATRR